jgi:hypothetical protein
MDKIRITIKRILSLFNIGYCIMCGKYRYKAPYIFSGGGVMCKNCIGEGKPRVVEWKFWE